MLKCWLLQQYSRLIGLNVEKNWLIQLIRATLKLYIIPLSFITKRSLLVYLTDAGY